MIVHISAIVLSFFADLANLLIDSDKKKNMWENIKPEILICTYKNIF